MHDAMKHIRARLGPAPRTLSAEDRAHFDLGPTPQWAGWSEDALQQQWAEFDDLIRHGTVAAGRIYMANTLLWRPGKSVAPAGVIYTTDPALALQPGRFQAIASELYRYHEGSDDPVRNRRSPWLRYLLDLTWSGLERPMHHRLPPALTSGHPVWHSSLVIPRSALPNGYITHAAVPMLVPPDDSLRSCAVVPHPFWPSALLRDWDAVDRESP